MSNTTHIKIMVSFREAIDYLLRTITEMEIVAKVAMTYPITSFTAKVETPALKIDIVDIFISQLSQITDYSAAYDDDQYVIDDFLDYFRTSLIEYIEEVLMHHTSIGMDYDCPPEKSFAHACNIAEVATKLAKAAILEIKNNFKHEVQNIPYGKILSNLRSIRVHKIDETMYDCVVEAEFYNDRNGNTNK